MCMVDAACIESRISASQPLPACSKSQPMMAKPSTGALVVVRSPDNRLCCVLNPELHKCKLRLSHADSLYNTPNWLHLGLLVMHGAESDLQHHVSCVVCTLGRYDMPSSPVHCDLLISVENRQEKGQLSGHVSALIHCASWTLGIPLFSDQVYLGSRHP
ncbi:hypothetical protein HBI56_108480 [Parastagonospora nodorum]|uniref:Uncharacterized protein n=1 Tax=Phaeosphaeria nodorum (strain SN15 / ATCC MYA-4574 / FGSC 10173) TaxID=321614 RepID=A0A7U2EXV7_PHANO|nr:hypothetical protein HBH56_041030 [Parastagonospora nodorum]QRC93035.1 hypothetical protein JI435_428800 [Parastagonospora nodorum SN15]KAH3933201.1 hypothetical protein HBH54_068780 [Parastagonospora nodorum]KAH3943480.1 hypothetical protein HBH53_172950 [Parastagonospora nodorum]KAH3961790.1 hypothetical protein HBH52_228140 [Parastagonospora nodorum]